MFFTPLETERLSLKNIGTDDRDFIYAEFSDKDVNQYLYDEEPLSDMAGADAIIRMYNRPEPRTLHRWIVIRKADGIKMGTCGFHFWNQGERTVEVGYDFQRAYWGHGYAQEALRALLRFAEEHMEIMQVSACIAMDNRRSVALAQRLGFTDSGRMQELVFRSKSYGHYVYTWHNPRVRS